MMSHQVDLHRAPGPLAAGVQTTQISQAAPTTPATDLPVTGVPDATRGARALSWLVDVAVVALTCTALWWWTHSVLLVGMLAIEWVVLLTLARARTGRTPGALATHTTAVRVDAPMAPGLRRQALRSGVQVLLQLTVVGPLVTALLAREGQDLADRISGLRLADTRRATVEQVLQDRAAEPARRADAHRAFMPKLTPARPSASQPAPTVAALDRAEAAGQPPASPTTTPQVVTFTHATQRAGAGHQPPETLEPVAPQTQALGAAAPHPETPRARPVVHEVAVGGMAAGDASSEADEQTRLEPTRRPDPSGHELEADTGERLAITGVIVLGRAPVAAVGETALPLPDPTRSMSRTHARIGVQAGRLWVQDANSANGSAIVGPTGELVPLPTGRRVTVRPGAVLAIGERRIRLG